MKKKDRPLVSDDHHPLLCPLGPQLALVALKHLAQRRAELRVDRVDLLLRRRVALHDVDRVADDGEDLLLVRHREAAPGVLCVERERGRGGRRRRGEKKE